MNNFLVGPFLNPSLKPVAKIEIGTGFFPDEKRDTQPRSSAGLSLV